MDIMSINPTVFDNSEDVPCPKCPYTLGRVHYVGWERHTKKVAIILSFLRFFGNAYTYISMSFQPGDR